MTMATRRRQFGETIHCEPSRFLDELPADDLRWQGREDASAEDNDARARETLAGLKSLFA